MSAREEWYACRDAGGQWPMMMGPYDESTARAVAREIAGWPVGFASRADRGDYLRRYEDGWRPWSPTWAPRCGAVAERVRES